MKSRTGVVLILLGTFLLGAISGAVSWSIYRRQLGPDPGARWAGAPRGGPHDIVGELARELELDDTQKKKLGTIFKKTRERYRALSREFRPRSSSIRRETDDEIRKILTESQKVRFEEIIKRMGRRHRRHMPPHGP